MRRLRDALMRLRMAVASLVTPLPAEETEAAERAEEPPAASTTGDERKPCGLEPFGADAAESVWFWALMLRLWADADCGRIEHSDGWTELSFGGGPEEEWS